MNPTFIDPQFIAFLAAVQGSSDPVAASAAVDWIQDRSISLTEMCMWYAFPPSWLRPTHAEDEAVRAVFWRWLSNVEPDRFCDYGVSEERWRWVRKVEAYFSKGEDVQKRRLTQKKLILMAFRDVVVADGPYGFSFRDKAIPKAETVPEKRISSWGPLLPRELKAIKAVCRYYQYGTKVVWPTVAEVASHSADEYLAVPDCGKGTLRRIKERLASDGLKLKGDA